MTDRPHLVIVDDDREIRTLLSQYLEKHDFRTTAVAEGKEMRRVMERSRVDLVVLDLMLPGEDGLSICRELRTRSQVPIIMLTARGEDVDRIVGLELGADDYLPKPFNPARAARVASGRCCAEPHTRHAIRALSRCGRSHSATGSSTQQHGH